MIPSIADSSSTVLILGESGTGKELIARALHEQSSRAGQPFIALNCTAVPENLLESELFGYVKGAFTGADPHGKPGKFELANKGTLFLDEIGDMPLYMQTKLLRVLQEREIVRLGDSKVQKIDVRIIAATHKDLRNMIREKTFREDLFYRLNVIPMQIDPLRERSGDIPLLAMSFLSDYSKKMGKPLLRVDPEFIQILEGYSWPGNIRELQNVMEYSINMMDESGVPSTRTLRKRLLTENTSVSYTNYNLAAIERRHCRCSAAFPSIRIFERRYSSPARHRARHTISKDQIVQYYGISQDIWRLLLQISKGTTPIPARAYLCFISLRV